MDTDGIVPSILPEVPPARITITYPNGKSVDFGKELTPHEVKEAPTVQWEADPQKYHTLYMFDPDAPSRRFTIAADSVHWVVGNVRGCDLSSGEVIAKYYGAGPPPTSGFHRYIFVVFEHDELVTFEKMSTMQRIRFSTKKFREKYKLEKVLAWNYFNSQWTRDPNSKCVLM